MTGLPAVEAPFEYEGLSVVPFVNKFADRGVETIDMIGLCHTTPLFAEELIPRIRLPTFGFMYRVIGDHVLANLSDRDGDKLFNLELSMIESISNYIRHPEEGLPYRPIVEMHIVHGEMDIALLTIENEDPNYDPRQYAWQMVPEQSRLYDTNGRGAIMLRGLADFVAHARRSEEPWMQYVAVKLS
ncbi:hypothetical protein GOV07_02070 [Candidatus Woesearchaeota archaeon]|nr:hypothetical protein [Candidatus Woesearchaeota archaeon]